MADLIKGGAAAKRQSGRRPATQVTTPSSCDGLSEGARTAMMPPNANRGMLNFLAQWVHTVTCDNGREFRFFPISAPSRGER